MVLFFALVLTKVYSQNLPYKFSQEIEKEKLNNKDVFALQLAATDFAFQGDYIGALRTWNEQRPNQKGIPFNTYDSLFLEQSKIVSAKEYIIERSKKESILILNELHHNPSHRIFASSLLKELYENGYRYLGLEALSDLEINVRKFATLESGFYTAEPHFANLIKEALDVGFILFGYEASAEAKWDNDKWKNREIAQAQNIYLFMQNHKEGKYFIYCGAGHAFEGDNNGRGLSMAGVLADLTKINPFTIDQNRYSYKADSRYNNPLSESIRNDLPSVLIHSTGEVFRGSASSYETDISVIQPSSTFENKPFFWLADYGTRFKVPYEKITSYPALVLIYREDEMEKGGVPAAVFELKAETEKKDIYLKKGNYRTVVLNKEYRRIYPTD